MGCEKIISNESPDSNNRLTPTAKAEKWEQIEYFANVKCDFEMCELISLNHIRIH